MAVHRYWQIKGLTTHSPFANWSVAEIQMAETVGGPNLCSLAGSFYASSEYDPSYVIANAFDHNNATDWSTTAPGIVGSYVVYDFGAGNEKEILDVNMVCRAGGGFYNQNLATGELWYSDDNVNWFKWSDLSGAAGTFDNEIINYAVTPIIISAPVQATELGAIISASESQPIQATELGAVVSASASQPIRATLLGVYISVTDKKKRPGRFHPVRVVNQAPLITFFDMPTQEI